MLKDYIRTSVGEKNDVSIFAKSEFNDDEFSDDIAVMDSIIEKYGEKTAAQLVNVTHRKNSAWHNLAEKNNLLNSSDIEIDFSYYLTGCASEFYNEKLEMHRHFETLKNYV